jgi:6-phosphogluconolactonase
MMKNNIKIFSDPFETAQKCADYLIELVNNSSQAHIALSGGSTPKILFDYLSDQYGHSKIWQKVNLYWGDERCVPPEHEESNYGMTKTHLLDKTDIPENNIFRIRGENNPQQEAKRYSSLLQKNLPCLNDIPVFDLVILGLGEDGHTASIFPGQMDLLNSVDVCAVAEHPLSKQKRITLTGMTINNARAVVFLVTGSGKKEKVAEIINKRGSWEKYPAAFINPENEQKTWFLDTAAASLL